MQIRSFVAFAFSAGLLLTDPVAAQYRPRLPDPIPVPGFKQLLPHGGIPALVNPDFVAADRARIPNDAWVLGYAVGDEAFAYDLNMLNQHEIANHTAGELPIAAVW